MINILIVLFVLYQPKYSYSIDNVQSKQLTPISQIDLMQELEKSHILVNKEIPSKNRLAAGWAQVALENGQGKFVYNYNLGNIGPLGKFQPYYYHSNETTYRSFESFTDGGKAYWHTLNRCKFVLTQFDNADIKGASYTLYKCKYYGADPKIYSILMEKLFNFARFKILK